MIAIPLVKRKIFVLGIYLMVLAPGLQQRLVAQSGNGKVRDFSQRSSDSSTGYWQLKTQVATRTTVIQFFGPNQQLLYEEIMPERWVKLSRRNHQEFDLLLAKLMANSVLARRIKTNVLPRLPPESNGPLPEQPKTDTLGNQPRGVVYAFINQYGKMRVLVDNPGNKAYSIELFNRQGKPLYREFTALKQYRRWLDLSELEDGPHKLIVKLEGQPTLYKVSTRLVQLIEQEAGSIYSATK